MVRQTNLLGIAFLRPPAYATPGMDALCRLQRELASCHVPQRLRAILGPSTHTNTRAAWPYKARYPATHFISLRITWSGHVVKRFH